MKAPYIKIYIIKGGKKDISQLVEKFKYEDSLDEDNLIEFHIKTDHTSDILNSGDISTGAIVQAHWGFLGEEMSDVREARITDVDVTYSDRIRLKVKAFDMGNAMRKVSGLTHGYKNITLHDFLKKVASSYGLNLKTDIENIEYKELVLSGNLFDFLTELVAQYDYVFYVRAGNLYVTKIKLDNPAKFLFSYGQENLISFSPKLKESSLNNSASNSTELISVDPKTKKTQSTESTNDHTSLDNIILNFSIFGDLENVTNTSTEEIVDDLKKVKKVLSVPPQEKEKQQKLTDNIAKKNKLGILEATLKVEGNPFIEVNEVITITNVATQHSGNWFVKKVVHTIGGNEPYICTCELTKDSIKKEGSGIGGGIKSSSVNKSKGSSNPQEVKDIDIMFSVDGDRKL